MIKVGGILIDMAMNVAGIKSDTEQAKRAVQGMANDVRGAVNVAKGALGALGLSLSAVGFAAFAKESLMAVAALDDIAESTGGAVEGLSRINNVARITGGSMETMQRGMIELNKVLAGLSERKGAEEAITALGLSIEQLRRLKPDEAIELIARRLATFRDGAEKSAVAVALFGRSGAELLPFLKDLVAYGSVASTVTAEQAAQAEIAANNIRRLGHEFKLLGESLALSALPVLQSFIDELEELNRLIAKEGGFWSGLSAFYSPEGQKEFARRRRQRREAAANLEALDPGLAQNERELNRTARVLAFAVASPEQEAAAKAAAKRVADYRRGLEEDAMDRQKDNQRADEKLIEEAYARQKQIADEESRYWVEKIEREQKADADAALRKHENALKQVEDEKRAAEEVARAWKSYTDDINRSLTDALLRGFESGKGFAENFKDTLKNMFETLVLRPVISFILSPISSTIGQLTGGIGGGYQTGFGTGFGTPGFGGGGSIMDLFSGNTLFTNAIFQKLGVATGSQFIADIGNYGFGTPLFAVAGNLLAGNPRGAALAGVGGTIGSIWGPAGAAIGTMAGQLLDSVLGGGNKSPAVGIGVQGTGTIGFNDLSGIGFQGRSANGSSQFAWPLPPSMVWDAYGIREQATQMLNDTFQPWIDAFEKLGLDADKVRGFRANVDFMQPGAMPWDLTGEGYIKAFGEALSQVTAQLQQEFGPALQLVNAEMQLEGQLRNAVRGLPQALGITTLEQYQNSLATSEYLAPGARYSAAHAQFSNVLARYREGDLSAINEIPGAAQLLLATGREMFASGPQFGRLFKDVNTILNDVLRAQREIEKDILKDIDVSIIEASNDQVAELRAGFKAVVDELAAVRVELRKLRAA